MDSHKENTLMGVGFILAAATAYAFMGALVKFSGENISDQQLVFFRNSICLLLLIPLLIFQKTKKEQNPKKHLLALLWPNSLRTSFLTQHLIRAVAGLLNMYCFFFSLRYILLADAMVLNNTMPLFLPLVVWIWKKEKISLHLIPGLIIGFLGVLFVLHPGTSIFQPASFLALASGIFMSVSMAGIRELTKVEPVYRILFYYFAISTLFSFFPLLWSFPEFSLFYWLLLFGVGFFAAIYQIFLTKGFQCASATKISPLIYFAVILSGMLDWIFWNKVPTTLSYIGIFLIIIGAIYCIRVESK